MTKIEHIQFLLLMIPTFLILTAAALSMADLAMPATPVSYTITVADLLNSQATFRDE